MRVELDDRDIEYIKAALQLYKAQLNAIHTPAFRYNQDSLTSLMRSGIDCCDGVIDKLDAATNE